MGFRLQQKSLTSNDLERPITSLSSVKRVYCDMTTEVRITQCLHKKCKVSAFSMVHLTAKFERGTLDCGLKLGYLVFEFVMLYLENGARCVIYSRVLSMQSLNQNCDFVISN